MKIIKYILSFFLFFCANLLPAQETVVVGQVVDKYDKKPLELVDVYFKNSNIAVQTNEEGYFLIKNLGEENTLVFSLLGYKKEEIKLKRGESVGLQMELEEKGNYLMDVFVYPGANPANDLMKKVRLKRRENNVNVLTNSSEQSAVFISKEKFRWENNKLFAQFKSGNLSENDSSLLLPLYMEESTYKQTNDKKEQTEKNTFNTSKTVSDAVSQLLRGMDEKLNFYENSVPVFGRSIISPLASISPFYYNYYLKDSIQADTGKQYEVQFWSKNTKNLVLNGTMLIDSASLALVKINAELPRQANMNFIHNFTINQEFKHISNYWLQKSEQTFWNLTYEIISDTINRKPELLISRNTEFNTDEDIRLLDTDAFANSKHSRQEISKKIEELNETPLFKFAKFVADAALTGYVKAWKFDIGNIINVARLTEQEGLRLSLPIRTNENMWKNFLLGGTIGYGFGDKQWKYGGEMQWKLPTPKRIVAGMNYSNDYHWIVYDKNDFLWRENPLATYDENISSTILSLKKGKNNSKRENLSFFVQNDWNDDIESRWIFGQERFFSNNYLPLFLNKNEIPELKTQYFTFTSRFSFNERVINEHFQRIYLYNHKPVLYGIAEIGKFSLSNKNGFYGNLSIDMLQQGRFTLGEWKYFAEAGKIIGSAPYPLLKFFNTKANGGYNIYQFSLMNFFEYPMDTYAAFHSELITNGLIFNKIPLIKYLNLREISSFKIGYGTVSNTHTQWLNYPINSTNMKYPYSEVSIGFTNLLRVITVQSVWRLTDLKKENVKPWGFAFYLRLSF
ncbi:conserved exported hypothetical protein [uncultured Paludibacter sp.]|uniref:Outer membrane protein n=1 Tax=uncultured Paludibacter sp. TaxID=497635 RepID=A0A653AGK8_9BACT|nr:conserved exported hypothetical protein [uncultured Paludibacter sp.]